MIHGQERHLWGGLVPWTGDTLGSNCVSGFKEGVGGVLRICRHCMGINGRNQAKGWKDLLLLLLFFLVWKSC